MKQAARNIFFLFFKEVRSLLSDIPLLIMILVLFTVAVISVSKNVTSDVRNSTIAVIDEDHSQLSRDMINALNPPEFKKPKPITRDQALPAMDQGEYIFVANFPQDFQSDITNFNDTRIQLLVDATAMTQAGMGTAYIQVIFTRELLKFFKLEKLENLLPTEQNTKIYFNENNESGWYTGVMQLVMDITLLSLILIGAAVIREKEHGTIEHLLVMPVNVFEIALAKIVANGAVILIAAMASLFVVIHHWLGIDINGSALLLLICCWSYIFAITSLGMFLATLTPSMPQYGLIVTPIIIISHLTSGGASPVEAMAPAVQKVVNFSPSTHFVYNIQDIIFRGAGLESISTSLIIILAYGFIFFVFALLRFKIMLQKFN